MSHLPNGSAQVASTAVTGSRTAVTGGRTAACGSRTAACSSRTAACGSKTAAAGSNSESGIVRTFAEDAQEKLSQIAKRR